MADHAWGRETRWAVLSRNRRLRGFCRFLLFCRIPSGRAAKAENGVPHICQAIQGRVEENRTARL
jgi:hypothetical protein